MLMLVTMRAPVAKCGGIALSAPPSLRLRRARVGGAMQLVVRLSAFLLVHCGSIYSTV